MESNELNNDQQNYQQPETGNEPQSEIAPISVTCGANSTEVYDLPGRTIGHVRKETSEQLNIPPQALVYVGSRRVDDSYIITTRDETIEFVKPSGSKGER